MGIFNLRIIFFILLGLVAILALNNVTNVAYGADTQSQPTQVKTETQKPALDRPVAVPQRITPVNVELDGTDSIGARLGMRLKERFNESSLFRLSEKNERSMRLLVSTRPEFKERPQIGSVYSICWVFVEGEGYLDFLLARDLGTIDLANVDALVDKIVERSDGLAVKYSSFWDK